MEGIENGIKLRSKDTRFKGEAELKVGIGKKYSKARAEGGLRPISIDM